MNHMPASVPLIDSGTVTAAARVGISRRMNTSTTSSTSTMVISMVYCTSSTLARIVVVRSEMTETWMSGGSHRISCGSRARRPSAVSMTLAPASLVMVSRIAGCLPSQAASLVLAVALTTLATSDSRRMAPLAVLMTSGRYCRGLPHLAVDADGFGLFGTLEATERLQHVGAADRVIDVLGGQAGGGQPDRIELDPDRGFLGAVDGDLGDAGGLRQPLRQDGVGGVVDLRGGQRGRGQRDLHDRRVGGIEFAVVRPRRQVRRQVDGGGVDRGLHVVGGAVDVAVDIELDDDRGVADRRGRGEFGDAGDFAEPALERGGDGGGHGFGPAPGRAAKTTMVGMSTLGSAATGRKR